MKKALSYVPLFKLLVERNMKKTDLIEACGISSATVAKLSKNEEVSLKTILSICELLDCKIEDVVEVKDA